MSHQQQPAQPQHERKRWIELSVPQLLAGALAAASAAFAASWLGVAGTVLGAVVASVVVSLSTALYSRPIERSSQAIRESLPVIPVLPERYRERAGTATETLVLGDIDAPADSAGPTEQTTTVGTLDDARPTRRIRWAAVAASSLAILVVGFGVLTAFEAVVGKSASSMTGGGGGGSTISRIVEQDGGSAGSGSDEKPTEPTKPAEGDDQDKPTQPSPTEPTDPAPTQPEPTDPEPTEPTPTEPTPTEPSTPDAGDTVPQDGQSSQDAPGAAIATDPA